MRRFHFYTKRTLLLLSLCLLAFPAPVFAAQFSGPIPNSPGLVKGTIRDQNGDPLSGVELFTADSELMRNITNDNGWYDFSLYEGSYTMTPYRTGYTFSPSSITFMIYQNTVTANFTATAHLWVKSVTPPSIFNDAASEITLEGAGFTADTAVNLDGLPPLSITGVTTDTLRAVVPEGVAPGSYDLHLSDGVTTDTLRANVYTLEDALAVTPAGRGELGAWRGTSSLNLDRTNFGLVQHDGYLYALGGTRSSGLQLTSVERALIQPDGSLGPWVMLTGAFQDTAGPLGAVQFDGWIYVAGKSIHTEWANILTDASLSAWNMDATIYKCSDDLHYLLRDGFFLYGACASFGDASMALQEVNIGQNHGIAAGWNGWIDYPLIPVPHNYAGMAQYGHALYAAGGLLYPNTIDEAPLAAVNRLPLGTDGIPGVWSALNPLSQVRGRPALTPAAGRLFALGGSGAGGTSLLSVESAFIQPDGSLGVWTVDSSRLTSGHIGGNALQVGNYIYLVGGGTRTVEFAPIHPFSGNQRFLPLVGR